MSVVLATVTAATVAVLAPSAAHATDPDVLGPQDVVRDVAAPTDAHGYGPLFRDGNRVLRVFAVDGQLQVLQDDLDSSVGWVVVPGQERDPSATSATVVGAARGVSVVGRRSGDVTAPTVDYRVTGPAGSWTLRSETIPVLDTQGAYLTSDDFDGVVVRSVATGTVVAHLADNGIEGAVTDSGQLWTLDWDGTISRRDLSDGSQPGDPVAVASLTPCADSGFYQFSVRGRWAVASCGTAGSEQTYVVDLSGVMRPRAVPGSATVLSDGALAQGAYTVVVTETGAEAPARQVATGSLRMRANGSGPGFAYVDRVGAMHVLDLALQPVADADVTAPTVSLASVPAVVPAERLSLDWTGTDPAGPEGPASGVARYDINESQDQTVSSSTIYLRPGQTTWSTDTRFGPVHQCFRVRAVDRRSNVGAWSDPTCTTVDTYPPGVTSVSYSITLRHASGTDAYVDYRFQRLRGDDDPATSLETRLRRSLQSSTTWTDWSTPYPSPTPLRTKTLHAGQRICFQGRGVDEVGNRSEWLPASCTAAPYDDSLARRSGSTSVFRSVAAFGGSARTLTSTGALSVSSYSSANCVSVRAIGGGINAVGTLDVSIGGRHVGTITPYYDTHTWGNFYNDTNRPMCGKGTVTVRHHAGSPPVTVDWIALTRPGDDGYEYGAR